MKNNETLKNHKEIKGRFIKTFSTFQEGFDSLLSFCGSALISLTNATDDIKITNRHTGEEEEGENWAVALLAINTANFRLTGNGVGWNGLRWMDATGLEYETANGTIFGWRVNWRDYQWTAEVEPEEKGWNTWVF